MSLVLKKIVPRYAFLRSTALATAACAALWSSTGFAAQSRTFDFDIPQQSLAVALRSYAQASGQQIIFSEDIVMGRQATPLQGRYTPEDALQRLLKDTGLVVERAPSGAAMIKRAGRSGQNLRGGSRDVRASKIAADVGGTSLPAGIQLAQASGGAATAAVSAPDTRIIGLEEVVVTARRREESLQRVPIAVQAFTEAQLSERRIETNTDLTKLVPSLSTSMADRSDEQFTLRGQTGYGASFSGQQVAAPIYLSEVPLPIGDGAGPGRYFDLQNIQVLKGPQGTLFGRNSTGGAVLLVPRKPTNGWGGYISGEYGNYNARVIEGAVNVPFMEDKVLFRAAGKAEHRDGFTYNPTTKQDLDDRGYITGRFSLLFKPTDTVENLTVVDIYHADTNGTSNHITNFDPNNFVVQILGGLVESAAAQKAAAGPRTTFTTVIGRNKIDALGVSNTTTWNITPDLTFKNIFGYRRFEQLLSYDYDGSPLTLINFDTCTTAGTCNTSSPNSPNLVSVEQITEEPQLQGTLFDKRLNYTLGLFYLHVRSPDSNYQHLTTLFGSTQDTNLSFNDNSIAGYGQVTYDLSEWMDGLKFTAGYRYTRDDRSLSVSQVGSGFCTTGTPGAAAPNPANAPQCLSAFNVKQSTSSYTVGADYQVNSDVMVYLTHRRGFRAGGINPFAGALALATPALPFAAQLFTYKPEIVTDVEGGVKADWNLNDMTLRTNLSVFHSHLKNAQIYQTIPVGAFTPFALTNAASADINGGELEVTFSPTESLELRGAYAYTDASFGPYLDYVNRTPTNQPTTATGRAFPFAPKHKFDVSVRYELPINEDYGRLSTTLSWSHKSTVLLALVPFTQAGVRDPAAYQNATNNLDLSVNWADAARTGFDARFYISNLTNTTYVVGGAALINSLGTDQAVYNEPRMFGIQIRKTFGTGG